MWLLQTADETLGDRERAYVATLTGRSPELHAEKPSAAVRAVLGHFCFVFIHPYMDGNGRMGRFLMNTMLASGGYPWTIIRVERGNEYMAALDAASAGGDIGPFADFLASCVEERFGRSG